MKAAGCKAFLGHLIGVNRHPALYSRVYHNAVCTIWQQLLAVASHKLCHRSLLWCRQLHMSGHPLQSL